MHEIPTVKNNMEYKNFIKVCSWDGYDWQEWFLENEGEKKGVIPTTKSSSGLSVIHLRSEKRLTEFKIIIHIARFFRHFSPKIQDEVSAFSLFYCIK